MTQPLWEVEREYARKLSAAGLELLTPRDAARLFGVKDATVRTAASQGKIQPVFRLATVRDLPLYKLSDLERYFTGRSVADPVLLAQMRQNGISCYVEGAGGWLLLSEQPGLRSWNEGVVPRARIELATP